MLREKIKLATFKIFKEIFEIENPEIDDDLKDKYQFDSIDAIELLREIEILLNLELTMDEKDKAMTIRTISQIIDYIESLANDKGIKEL